MKKRLFTTYLILILIGTLTTGIFSLKLIITNYETGIKDRLITSGNLINSSLEKIQEDGEEFNYYKLSQDFAKQAEAAITFIDDTGQAVADSSDNSIIFVNQMDKPEVRGAVSGNIATSKRISNISKQNTLYIAMPPIELSGRKIVTRLAFPLADVSKLNELLLKSILTSIVIGIIFAISIGYWYVEKIASPIKRITAASKLISMGQLDKRVDISTKDEIEELANNFNNMASKLSKMITEINDNNVKLNAILTSMTDGILAIDNDNRIILLNPAIQRMLEIPSGDIIGKHLSEVLISSDLHDLISDTAENSKIQEIEFTSKDDERKIVKIYTNMIQDSRNDLSQHIGVLMVVQDVTEIRKLEKLRTEFVINASHELKTPLTSISGFIETLKLGAANDKKYRDRFLNIIEEETNRLGRLVNAMLTLSDIENAKNMLKNESIDVFNTVREVIYMFKPIAYKKKINLRMDVEQNLKISVYNKDWFKQIIINLVDNAIKYTPDNGQVKIIAYNKDDSIHIIIKDNGLGIPKEDIPRLFERFYRVDKTRSRKLGGVGLGLAIVKHIVMSYGGNIEVRSKKGKGSEFIIEIPGVS